MADRPRTADYAWTVLARVLSVAKDRGLIAVNVCKRGGRLYETNRTEIIWTAEHISKFCAVVSEPLQFALLLALWTGQRQGDLVRLTWMYDGSKIRLRQGKSRGKRRVVIPVGPPLKTALDGRRPAKAEGVILRNTLAEPWDIMGEGVRSGRAGRRRLAFPQLARNRPRLALSGCTVREIAAITGHSPRDVEAILEAPYLGGRMENCPKYGGQSLEVFARFEYPDDPFDGDFTEFAGREEDLFTWFSPLGKCCQCSHLLAVTDSSAPSHPHTARVTFGRDGAPPTLGLPSIAEDPAGCAGQVGLTHARTPTKAFLGTCPARLPRRVAERAFASLLAGRPASKTRQGVCWESVGPLGRLADALLPLLDRETLPEAP
jgi:hypothetical protein